MSSADPGSTPPSAPPVIRTTTYVLNFSPTRSRGSAANNHLLRIPADQQPDDSAALAWARALLASWGNPVPFNIAYLRRVDPVPGEPGRVVPTTLRLFYRHGAGGVVEAIPGQLPREARALALSAGRASS